MSKYLNLLQDIVETECIKSNDTCINTFDTLNSRAGVSISPDKIQYNKLLEKWHKAEAYMNDDSISITEKEKHVEGFKKLMKDLSVLLNSIGIYTKYKALNGFTEANENIAV